MPDKSSTEVTVYHNPRCSKSRQALELIEGQGVQPHIVKYLETPPTAAELDSILDMLGLEPRDLMRRQEDPYAALGLDNPALTREQLIAAMVENPILIERPVIVSGTRAVVGRPPEKVLELL